MYWASNRRTTRLEDAAYCLMGIFDVNMPIIYGEGTGAFRRLQEEISKDLDDPSLFAWQKDTDWRESARAWEEANSQTRHKLYKKVFAPSPASFEHCGRMFPPLGIDRFSEDHGHDDSEIEDSWDSMSTTSTLVQDSTNEGASPFLIQAIKFLRDDTELFSLFRSVTERPGVGIDRFRRILVNILRYLAVELGEEANDKDQKSSAQFVRKYRLVIASAITQSVAEKTSKPVELGQDAQRDRPDSVAVVNEVTIEEAEDPVREESADEEDDDQVEVDVPFDSITTFIRSSKAYAQMAKRLADLAYPSFRSRATEWVEKWLRRKRSESDDIGHWEAMRSRMFLIISELQYSQPEKLLVDKKGEASRFERFQLRIESLAGEEWNWWPLLRPRPKIGLGESRLGWNCVSV